MAIISLVDATLSFGAPALVSDANAQIQPGERIALLGRNGCGKSTFLKCLAGVAEPSRGEVHCDTGLVRGFLPQEVPERLDGTVYQVVASGLAGLSGLLMEYHEAAQFVSDCPGEEALRRLEQIQQRVETEGAFELHERVLRTVNDLSLQPDASFQTLSGGLKRRTLLARALAAQPDLLLLDEPTNHLDIDSIGWLEKMLLRFEGALLLVTHDRMLVRRVATRILDIDRGRLTSWACDYHTFCRRKEEALANEAAQWDAFDKKLAREEVWVRQGIKARRTRNEGRVRALERMRTERAERRQAEGKARMLVQQAKRPGDMIIEVEGLTFGYGESPIVENFSTRVIRGDRIGVLGRNGSGKTTLLRLLLGTLEPDAGTVAHGTRLEVTYYDQLRSALKDDQTVLEAMTEGREVLVFDGRPVHVYAYMENFLFHRDRANTPVSALSGGERNRLVLARLLSAPSNVLVMDEPTNDLDVETLELLEQLLIGYEGTLLLVSHDREFLNNVVTSTMVVDGAGGVTEYAGGYDDWLAQRPAPEQAQPAGAKRRERKRPSGPRKLTFNEKAELEGLEPRIEQLEAEREELFAQMADPEFYRGEGTNISAAQLRVKEVESELGEAYARWEELESIREQSGRQNR